MHGVRATRSRFCVRRRVGLRALAKKSAVCLSSQHAAHGHLVYSCWDIESLELPYALSNRRVIEEGLVVYHRSKLAVHQLWSKGRNMKRNLKCRNPRTDATVILIPAPSSLCSPILLHRSPETCQCQAEPPHRILILVEGT